MIIPVRCFSCGKVVAEYYEEFAKRISKSGGGEKPEEVLNSLGIDRYCCRRMILSHVDLMDDVIKYSR